MLDMGWGAYMCVSLSFSRNVSFLFLMPKSRGWGEEGGCKKPGMGGSRIGTVPSLALNPTT